MEPKIVSMILMLLLLLGCDSRPTGTETKMELPSSSGTPKSEWQTPAPRYGMPLDIHVDAPDTPEDIQRPSPPIAPGTPMPGSVFDNLLKGSK